jgi:hypothetical protein
MFIHNGNSEIKNSVLNKQIINIKSSRSGRKRTFYLRHVCMFQSSIIIEGHINRANVGCTERGLKAASKLFCFHKGVTLLSKPLLDF